MSLPPSSMQSSNAADTDVAANSNSANLDNAAQTDADEAVTKGADEVAKPSYTKLAMRNMVRKRGTSLMHFSLTVAGLLGVLVGLAYLTR